MSNMYRWVDPRVNDVRVAEVPAYMARHGWKENPSPRPTALVFAEPRADDGQRIIQVLPISESFADYRQRLVELITGLAVIEDRLAVEVLNDILDAAPAQPPNGATRRNARRAKPTKR